MGHKNRQHKRAQQESPQARITVVLQAHAVERTSALGHRISSWMPAKARHGKGAKKAICISCGMIAIAMPAGTHETKRSYWELPALRGDALFTVCDPLPQE